jgi:hypothetical protein
MNNEPIVACWGENGQVIFLIKIQIYNLEK